MFPREHEINVFYVYKTETRAYVKRWDCALYTLLIITKPLVSTYRFRLSAKLSHFYQRSTAMDLHRNS